MLQNLSEITLVPTFFNRAMHGRDAGGGPRALPTSPRKRAPLLVAGIPVFVAAGSLRSRQVWAVENGLANTTTAFDSKHKRIPGSRVLDTLARVPRRIARGPYRSTTSICLLPRFLLEKYCGRLRGRLQWVRRVIGGHLFGLQGRGR